jgi:lysophospholipase L1-like esterase
MNPPFQTARALLILALVSAAIATRVEAAGISSYISLGDSIAYGSGSAQDAAPGSGTSSGFVSQFAGSLSRSNGGAAPNVFNLALPNETLASFTGGNPAAASNTLYTSGSRGTQNGMFLHYMASELAAGHKIDTVTVALGTSDINNILKSAGFSTLPLSQQAAKVEAGLAQIQSQYSSLLGDIHNVLPNTRIDLIGAYNPYHATPSDPIAPIAEAAFLGLNKIIQGEATSSGATYVDTYTKFLGNEGTYTNILGGKGDINPSASGFSAIAAQLDPTVVPEPSTLFLAAFGVAGLAGHSWRRKNRAA